MAPRAHRPPLTDGDVHRMTWPTKAVRVLAVTDALCIILAVVVAQAVRFTDDGAHLPTTTGESSVSYTLLSACLVLAWWGALWLGGARNSRILGAGNAEYIAVVRSSLWLFAAIAIVSYAFAVPLARGYVLIALPVGLVLLMLARWAFRVWLVRRRSSGRALIRVLIIGDAPSSAHLANVLHGASAYGYRPVAAYLAGSAPGSVLEEHPELPILGYAPDPEQIMAAVQELAIDVVAVSTGHRIKPRRMRRLGWLLADEHVGLMMAPALTDIAGPRFHTQPLNGLPLIHVGTPRMRGPAAAVKRLIDVAASAVGLLLLSPLLLVLALLVKADSPGGPVLFRQERVGYQGEPFRMLKFRSMVPNAEQLKAQLMERNEGNGVLFKMADDPRITRVGRFMRRYSLDELPQLFNVLRGDMSLVGPRPPLREEVEHYEQDVHRRLLVKPGITGLWQVSGRSDLSWEESTRLDLYYVENWSVLSDLLILLKTVRAVVGKDGAY